MVKEAAAAGGKVADPKGIASERYVHYPGTEPLGKEEIRLIACGTGMSFARRNQAATCFLVELGDGQKFLFDIGSGSHANLQALMIPSDFLTKIFLTHLHTDHWTDLVSLWAGGWTAGRTVPLEIWGPSGAREDMGTKHAVEKLLEAYNWDYMTRAVTISPGPGKPLLPDRTRKSEYTQFILNGKFDSSDVDGPWLKKFMKEHGLHNSPHLS